MSSSRHSTSSTSTCCPARPRAPGAIPDTTDSTTFCIWLSLATAWGQHGDTQGTALQGHQAIPRPCWTHLGLGAGVGQAGDGGGSEEQVEGHGQEGQVTQQLETLGLQHGPAQQVREAQPLQGQAHGAQAGISHLHLQEVLKEALEGWGWVGPTSLGF